MDLFFKEVKEVNSRIGIVFVRHRLKSHNYLYGATNYHILVFLYYLLLLLLMYITINFSTSNICI